MEYNGGELVENWNYSKQGSYSRKETFVNIGQCIIFWWNVLNSTECE